MPLPAIVIVSRPLGGRLNMVDALAASLRVAGYVVSIATPAAPPRWLRDRNHLLEYRADRAAPRAPAAAQVEALNLDRLVDEVATATPDLVLVDIELPGQLMALAGSGMPVVAWTDMLSLWSAPRVPPLSSTIVPGNGLAGSRLGIAAAWLRFRIWKWVRFWRLRLALRGADELSVMRVIASGFGFPLRKEAMLYQWLIPFSFRTIPTLLFNAPEIEFPHLPRPNVEYVGPMVDLRRATGRALDPDDRERLDRILRAHAGNGAGKLIYVAFGAWDRKGDSELMDRIIAAIADRPGWEAIVSLGDREGPTSGPAANVHLFDWVAQIEVLEAAAAAVHHGGINTLNECVMTGTPMLIYARDRLDRPGNAARVAYHRLGIVGDRNSDTLHDISRRLELLLTDKDIQRSTAQLRDRYVEYVRSKRAVAVIDELITGLAAN